MSFSGFSGVPLPGLVGQGGPPDLPAQRAWASRSQGPPPELRRYNKLHGAAQVEQLGLGHSVVPPPKEQKGRPLRPHVPAGPAAAPPAALHLSLLLSVTLFL